MHGAQKQHTAKKADKRISLLWKSILQLPAFKRIPSNLPFTEGIQECLNLSAHQRNSVQDCNLSRSNHIHSWILTNPTDFWRNPNQSCPPLTIPIHVRWIPTNLIDPFHSWSNSVQLQPLQGISSTLEGFLTNPAHSRWNSGYQLKEIWTIPVLQKKFWPIPHSECSWKIPSNPFSCWWNSDNPSKGIPSIPTQWNYPVHMIVKPTHFCLKESKNLLLMWLLCCLLWNPGV